MKLFKTSPYGDTVDLNNSETYKHLPSTCKELRNLMLREIGYTQCYMNYWHKDVFDNPKRCANQKERVNKLITEFSQGDQINRTNLSWYQEQVFLFQDEIENMC